MAKIRKPRKKRRRSRTRKRDDSAWQIAIAPVDREQVQDSKADPRWLVMLVDVDSEMPIATETAQESELVEQIAHMLNAASKARMEDKLSRWPAVIQVRSKTMDQLMNTLLANEDVKVVRTDDFSALQAATQALVASIEEQGPRFFVPDLPIELYDAASALAERAPWTGYTDTDELIMRGIGDTPDPEWPVALILGHSGQLHGLSLHRPDGEKAAATDPDDDDGTAGDILNAWFHPATSITDTEKELYRNAGYEREDWYPAFSVLVDGPTLVAPDADAADAMTDGLEAINIFLGAFPEPPDAGSSVRVEWDDHRVIEVVYVPKPDEQSEEGAPGTLPDEVPPLAPFDMQFFLLELGRDALESFNEAVDEEATISGDALDSLPEQLRAWALRGRKADIRGLLEEMDALGVDGFGWVSPEALSEPIDAEKPNAGVIVAMSGDEVVGTLMASDETFVATLDASAEALDAQPVVIFSGGGTRLKPGKVRGRDAVAMRRLWWRGNALDAS